LTWDNNGNLGKVSSDTKGDSTYTYTAEGQLLSQHDPANWTLYLPDGQLTLTKATGAVSGIRYYSLPGGDTAHRTGSGAAFGFDIADAHGTVELTLDNTAQLPTWRAFTPYGDHRGTATTWFDNRTFLDKPADDNTGFVNVGARFYDPGIGSFISLDPVLNGGDPQSLGGYAYADDAPTTRADPSGQMPKDPDLDTQFGEPKPGTGPKHVISSPGGNTSGGGNTGSPQVFGGNNSTPGSSCSSAQPVKKHWWQRGLDWVSDNRNMIIGAATGFVAFAGCEALTGGLGSIGCMAVGGAAGNLMTDALNGDIHSASDVVDSLATGALEGAAAPELAGIDLINQGGAVVDDVKHGDYAGAAGHAGLGALDALTIADGVRGPKARGAGCNSFAPATAVLMANGSTKPIGQIQLGDKVLATDPETDKSTAKPVTALHDDIDRDFVDLTVADAHGDKTTIHTTAHHPFWNQTTKAWTDAGDLKPGNHLRTTTVPRKPAPLKTWTGRAPPTTITVVSLSAFTSAKHMYNITVNDLHTYYVLAGETPVLVHNCGDLPEGYRSSPGLEGDPYHPDSVAARSRQNQELYGPSLVDRAAGLGYTKRVPAQKAPFNSHGQTVFSNGKNYITRDIDGHNVTDGWKMFNRQGQRIGTYDSDLNYLKE
jgi:RHS repeat-associated protein